jgi:hypothetical protein
MTHMAQNYRIWCQVSGGVTGTGEGWLKRNSEVVTFESQDEAEAYARELRERNNSQYAKARFRYTVVTEKRS